FFRALSGIRIVVVRDLAKVEARVRFPYPAPSDSSSAASSFFAALRDSHFDSRKNFHSSSHSHRLCLLLVCRSLAILAYLCGPIEFAEQDSKLWRQKLAPFLRDQLLHRVYDPVEDGRKNLTPDETGNFERWKMTDMDRFRRVARRLIAANLE